MKSRPVLFLLVSLLAAPCARASLFGCLFGAVQDKAEAGQSGGSVSSTNHPKALAEAEEALAKAKRDQEKIPRGVLNADSEKAKRRVEDATQNLALQQWRYLGSFFRNSENQAGDTNAVYASSRGKVVTLVTSNGQKTPGQFIDIESYRVNIITEVEGHPVKRSIPIRDLVLSATQVSREPVVRGKLDADLAAIKTREEQKSKIDDARSAAAEKERLAANERNNPTLKSEYRPGAGQVVEFTLPTGDPLYLEKLEKWANNARSEFPGLIHEGFLKKLPSGKVEFHIGAQDPKIRAYLDNAFERLKDREQDPSINLSSAMVEVRRAHEELAKSKEREHWADFLSREENYLKHGTSYQSIDTHVSNVHGDVALDRFSWNGVDPQGKPFRATTVHIRNKTNGEIYGKEVILRYQDPVTGEKHAEFFATGTHIQETRRTEENCTGCHDSKTGALGNMANAFDHGRQNNVLTDLSQVKPWVLTALPQ